MLKIRLRRVGSKRQPSYRVVVAESTAPRDGRFVENVGFYNPRTQPETIKLKEDRVLHWLSVGAQPTDSMARLLKKRGTLGRFERLKSGEAIEVLVAEAAASEPEISPKTKPAIREKVVPVAEVVETVAASEDVAE